MRTVPEQVSDWTVELKDRLNAQYKRYTVKSLETFTSDYANARLKKINNGTEKLTQFVVRSGRKYYKINQSEWRDGEYVDTSVHCFVDKNTGEVYKPASWKSPAAIVRYDMRIINQREAMYANCDWAGGYLYLR